MKYVAGPLAALALGCLVASFSAPASAATTTCPPSPNGTLSCSGSISVTLGTPQPSETKIFIDAQANPAMTGTGHIGSQTGLPGFPIANFATDVNVSFVGSGQGEINGSPNPHGTFGSLTFSLPAGFGFTDLEFFATGETGITITASNGGTATNTSIGPSDNNWFIIATNNTTLTSLTISALTGAFSQMKQFEISGVCTIGEIGCTPIHGGGATPLPGALPLFVGGLGAMGLFGWRKKRKNSVALAAAA